MIPWQFLVFSPLGDYPLKRNTKKIGSQFQVGLLKSDSKVSNLVRVSASAGFTVSAFPLASSEPDAPFSHPARQHPIERKNPPPPAGHIKGHQASQAAPASLPAGPKLSEGGYPKRLPRGLPASIPNTGVILPAHRPRSL